MEVWNAIASIPGIGPYLPYVAAFGMCCAAIATCLPPPSATDGTPYKAIYRLVQWAGLNIGHARNKGDA